MKQKRHRSPFRWCVWGLAVLFIYYEYMLRVSPSVMIPELIVAFQVSTGAIGALSAFYLYAYAPLQFPIGIIMDRYGARRLLSIASAICGLGGVFFGLAPHIALAEAGRFLMGMGSAFAWVGLVYVTHHWFPPKRLALLIGLGNSLGMLGAVTGEGPLSFAVERFGWRVTILALAGIGFAISILIFLVIRNSPKSLQLDEPKPSRRELLDQVRGVLANRQSWIVALGSLFFYITVVSFAALWGVPFIRVVYGVSRSVAAFAASMIYIGFIVGGPIIGHLADRLHISRLLLLIATALSLATVIPILYFPQIGITAAYVLLFLLGALSSAELLSYSFITSINLPAAKGTAIAFTNTMVFLGGSIAQPLVGFLLDTFWEGIATEGSLLYPPIAYQIVLTICPLTQLIGLIIYFFLTKAPLRRAAPP